MREWVQENYRTVQEPITVDSVNLTLPRTTLSGNDKGNFDPTTHLECASMGRLSQNPGAAGKSRQQINPP